MMRRLGLLLALATAMFACVPGAFVSGAARAEPTPTAKLLELLKQPGHIAFMRHAWAPFDVAPKSQPHSAENIGPCATQRNLDDFGRKDAARVGAVLRAAGVTFDHVWTSHVCRCRETAEQIMGRPVDNLPLINSYFADPDKARGPAQLKYLRQFVTSTMQPKATALMVTHGSLITDLAGIDTGETEIVIMKSDGAGGLVVVAHGTL